MRSSRTGRSSGRQRRASRRSAMTSSGRVTQRQPRPDCPAWRGAPPATRWPAATPFSSRCRGGVTCRRWPAFAIAPRPGARRAPVRLRPRRATRSRPVAGAAGRPGRGAARGAAGRGCGPSSSDRHAPRRSSAGHSRACPCAPRPAIRYLNQVAAGPSLVVATPGAEPPADGGYGAALLLDGWALLARPDLRAAEEAFRRWSNAAALVRSDGQVVVGAEASIPAVQALVRWDAVGHAARELAERAELGFPPAVRMASLAGAAGAVAETLELAQLPEPERRDRPGSRPPMRPSACSSEFPGSSAVSWRARSRRRPRSARPARPPTRSGSCSIPARRSEQAPRGGTCSVGSDG